MGELSSLLKKVNKFSDIDLEEQDIIDVFEKIAFQHRTKDFGYFTQEDIMKEVWVICLSQLDKYDPSKGKGDSALNSIERWFNRIVKNRLNNFHRDHYSSVNEKYKQSRINLANQLNINEIDITNEKNAKVQNTNHLDKLIYDELEEFVRSRLDDDLLDIYNDCMDQETVSTYYQGKLKAEITKIMAEWHKIHEE